MKGKVLKWEVKRRTFEGKINKSKNDNSLTSEYYYRYKYVACYTVQWDHGGISEMNKIYVTKKEAIEGMEFKERYGLR